MSRLALRTSQGRDPAAGRGIGDAAFRERGGRPTTEAVAIPLDPYDAYVGLLKPSSNWAALNKEFPLTVVLLDPDGRPISGRELQIAVYTNERNWWWEYRSFDDYRRRFKSDVQTRLVDSLEVTTDGQPVTVNYTPTHHGQVLIEVKDPEGGHVAGTFVWVSSWGRSSGPMEAGTQLEMEVEHETYHPGDTARVTVKTPSEGIAFVSVEKADTVLSHRWEPLDDEQTTIEVEITEEMLPDTVANLCGRDRSTQLGTFVRAMVTATAVPVSITDDFGADAGLTTTSCSPFQWN